MRDVDGSITFYEQTVVRHIHPNAAAKPFLRSAHASTLVESGKMVPFAFVEDNIAHSPRLPFVSYPFEWCDAQLHQAGQLTLDVSREVLDGKHELKDASAWNVIFEGNRPLFCDHLSFQPIESPQWWAFGQFARHFLLPLAASQQRGFRAHRSYSTWRDGMPPEAAREMFGFGRFLTRYWPLMVGSGKSTASATGAAQRGSSGAMHGNLYAFCQTLLNGVKPRRAGASHWSSYTRERSHYPNEASSDKYRQVAAWLEKIAPAWVVDLGCNSGEYSLLAAKTGASVVAVDLDHDSIQDIVLAHPASSAIHPLVSNLGDMVGGRGWCGDEFPSLMNRLQRRADTLLMLALIHHLAISEAISLEKIAHMAAHITRDYLIVELLAENDPMVVRLCEQRRRNPQEFSLAAQETAFARHFRCVEKFAIPGTQRTLCLFKKTAAA